MHPASLPRDHAARLQRARLSLDGLSVGDALGSQFFVPRVAQALFGKQSVPPGPWGYTDDTEMALGVVEVLERLGTVEPYELAAVFARRYRRDIYRGYGAMAHEILSAIGLGTPWRNASHAAFNGQGSMGNGAAMRVAPLGAYFAEDDERVIAEQADRSAEVTHAHPEGRAGAVATALAAAWAWRQRAEFGSGGPARGGGRLLAAALAGTPEGATRAALRRAAELPPGATVEGAVEALGNGSRVTAPDTVPFCLWVADRHLGDYPAALWSTVAGRGDVDTTCAIVGGVVALAAPSIPPDWIAAREPLDAQERQSRG